MKPLKILVAVRSERSEDETSNEIFPILKNIDAIPAKIAFDGVPAHVKIYVFHDSDLSNNVIAGAAKACYPEAWLTKAFCESKRERVVEIALQDAVDAAEDVILFLGDSDKSFIEDALAYILNGAETSRCKGVTACSVKHFTGSNRTPLITKLLDGVGTIP